MPTTQIISPHIDAILAALQHQGDSNDCGPYTTATILNALLDLNLDGSQLAQQMDKPVWRGPLIVIRRVPNWATFPWGIVDVMREHGEIGVFLIPSSAVKTSTGLPMATSQAIGT